ncbi:hypothetical protein A9973_30340 [Achromobacter sp. UMC46]|nr:hypothetical protein [Achromobacter sp. UMC46]MBB1598374.1 hypothetical protein [Achromobacter sp. UMC46]
MMLKHDRPCRAQELCRLLIHLRLNKITQYRKKLGNEICNLAKRICWVQMFEVIAAFLQLFYRGPIHFDVETFESLFYRGHVNSRTFELPNGLPFNAAIAIGLG